MIIDGVEIDDALRAMLVPGAQIRYLITQGSSLNELRHIRAIVDESYVVYRVWWKHHQRWEYKITWMYDWQIEWRYGWLHLVKHGKKGN